MLSTINASKVKELMLQKWKDFSVPAIRKLVSCACHLWSVAGDKAASTEGTATLRIVCCKGTQSCLPCSRNASKDSLTTTAEAISHKKRVRACRFSRVALHLTLLKLVDPRSFGKEVCGPAWMEWRTKFSGDWRKSAFIYLWFPFWLLPYASAF